jgi:ankyrin repeat protein
MAQKTIDRVPIQGYTGKRKVQGIGKLLADLAQLKSAWRQRSEKKSLTLYFDNIVAGEPTQSVKNTELVVAASYGDTARVSKLVANGAEVHTGNDRPLQVAAANGHTEIVKYLLEEAADATAEDDEALIEAARSGYDDIVALLLDYGANVDARNGEPLRLASQSHIQTPGAFNARRRTPLDGHAKTIELLRACAARPA